MGFFNWVMNGLGFETENKEKKSKNKAEVQETDKYAEFNLHEKVDATTQTNDAIPTNNGYNNFGIQAESNIIMVEPKSFKDVQQAIDYLKQGQIVQLNLGSIAQEDSTRILDFLSGAIYGLNGSIHRWYGDLFLLAPEGHKILKKESN